jgi:hypothetical protein
MRTPGMTTLSSPIVQLSPTATPSCRRACWRMSQARPTIAPSIEALRPTEVDASTTERDVRAWSRRVTLGISTEYGPTEARWAMRQ